MQDILIYKNKYNNSGYFIIRNALTEDIIFKAITEIKNATNTDKYFDSKGQLRRIERLYDKGKVLKKINQTVLNILKNIFDEEFVIFKDKYNAKPPGGEGFFAHYDGVFMFKDKNNVNKRGWYEYSNIFINALIALDPCNKENGTIEISKIHDKPFEKLLLKTKQNNTPDLLLEIEEKLIFEEINLNLGDIVIFSNKCPHRSQKNKSQYDRKTLYYTYTPLKNGSFYDKYFKDKLYSKNLTSKSLGGEI